MPNSTHRFHHTHSCCSRIAGEFAAESTAESEAELEAVRAEMWKHATTDRSRMPAPGLLTAAGAMGGRGGGSEEDGEGRERDGGAAVDAPPGIQEVLQAALQSAGKAKPTGRYRFSCDYA